MAVTHSDIRELFSYLMAIAANTERIADALEKANENDPVGMIAKAMEDAPKPEPPDLELLPPDQRWRLE